MCWNAGGLSQIRQKVLAVGGRSCVSWIVWNYTIFNHILEKVEMIIWCFVVSDAWIVVYSYSVRIDNV